VFGAGFDFAYGPLMDPSGWPFALGVEVPGHSGSWSFAPGAPPGENQHRFAVYTVLASTGSFDTGRALTNAVALTVVGTPVLVTSVVPGSAGVRRVVTPDGARGPSPRNLGPDTC
jgi:energy-coupling factor transport system substrate-specific component